MTPDLYDKIIDQFDKHMRDPEKGQILPPFIADDPESLQEWKHLKIAVEAIRFGGLNAQVAAIREQLHSERASIQPTRRGKVHNLFFSAMKVAAAILLVVSLSGIGKYIFTTPSQVYEKYYTSYELGTTRGASARDKLEKAYREKNWSSVLHIYGITETKTSKTYFLAAMADLEQKNYPNAIEKFKTVIRNNGSLPNAYFQDESEYYLALSYLANNQTALAMSLLRQIKADPNHLFNKKVTGMSRVDMPILNAKEGSAR